MKLHDPADAEALRIFAPAGVIRIALNVQNAATVTIGNEGLTGPAPRLARDLSAWTGLPTEITHYASAGQVLQALDGDAPWDLSFLAVDPARADRLAYSRPYLTIESTAVVRSSSDMRHVDQLDRPGIRIASSQGAAYDLALQRQLRHARRFVFADPRASFDGFEAQGLDAVAGVRATLMVMMAERTDLCLLNGCIAAIEHALAVPREREAALPLLARFLVERLGRERIAEGQDAW